MNPNVKRAAVLAGVVVAVFVIVTSAIAAARPTAATKLARDPLAGIAAAAQPAAALDAQTTAWLRKEDANVAPQVGAHLLNAARRLGALPTGKSVNIVPTSMGKLCVDIPLVADSCSDGLSAASPITETIIDVDGSGPVPALVYGAARDGVVSVTLSIAGQTETVSVHNNLYALAGKAGDTTDAIAGITANLSDGSHVPIG